MDQIFRDSNAHAEQLQQHLLLRFCAMKHLFVAAALMLGSGGAHAEEIVGRASVVDGDTIDVQGARIRFDSVDAREAGQRCVDADGIPIDAGGSRLMRSIPF